MSIVNTTREGMDSAGVNIVVNIDNNDKYQLVSAAGSPLRKCVVAGIGHTEDLVRRRRKKKHRAAIPHCYY
jgi:hypothetical protein